MNAETQLGGAMQAALASIPLRCVRQVGLVGSCLEGCRGLLAQRGVESAVLDSLEGADVFDGLFLDLRDKDAAGARRVIQWAKRRLEPHGALYLILPPSLCDTATLAHLIPGQSLLPYSFWQLTEAGGLRYHEGAHAPDGATLVAMAVPNDYDPLAHARALFDAGHPGWSLEVLDNIPPTLVQDEAARGLIHAERMRCLLEFDKHAGAQGRLNRFARAQDDFYKSTTFLPRYAPPYHYRAVFWHRLGRNDLAHATLRTALHFADDPAAEELRRALPPPEYRAENVKIRGDWRGDAPRRILYIMRPPADYGADVLYDGLCTVLGAENVVEYPWKPTLHGQEFERAGGYPCTFNRPGKPLGFAELLAQAQAGRFDAILYTDVFQELEGDKLRALVQAAAPAPLFIVDTWDQCGDYSAAVRQHLGGAPVRAVFKREMIAGVDYGPDMIPLSFAYPDDRIPQAVDFEHRAGCFWAGNAEMGLRRLYLEWLAEHLGFDPTRRFSQEEYTRALQRASFGLSLFGNGFDTVRYWELPAHGCMLLSERPPIRIPNNFVDGVNAVFFDDLADLEEKVRYYLAHPEEARPIAEAGHGHLRRYHTGSARARELLGHIERLGAGKERQHHQAQDAHAR